MNKLCAQNVDFRKFIRDVKIDFKSKCIHNSEYDKVINNPDEYIEKLNRTNRCTCALRSTKNK